MSMIAHLRPLSPKELARLIRQPDQIERFLARALIEPKLRAGVSFEQFFAEARSYLVARAQFLKTMDRPSALGFMKQIATKLAPHLKAEIARRSAEMEQLFGAPVDSLDIGKAWSGIHFMLNGDPWEGAPPLGNVLLGGTVIGEDLGYGPARYLTAREVEEVAAALKDITVEEFAAKFDYPAMVEHQVYAIGAGEEEDLLWLCAFYEQVRDLYRKAAADGQAMLHYLD